ncbi:hypothetical protein [Bradyrhizobium zhanjiangense]|nr:hypothetical protein [Bradyrhizobium zhanjiangense]
MAGKPKEGEREDRRQADKPPADHSEQPQTAAEDPAPGIPPFKD